MAPHHHTMADLLALSSEADRMKAQGFADGPAFIATAGLAADHSQPRTGGRPLKNRTRPHHIVVLSPELGRGWPNERRHRPGAGSF